MYRSYKHIDALLTLYYAFTLKVMAKSPTGSTTSLKSLRSSMQASILPSMVSLSQLHVTDDSMAHQAFFPMCTQGSKASLGAGRSGSKASMRDQSEDKKTKSPTGSSTSLKSLRTSMKSMILPSMVSWC